MSISQDTCKLSGSLLNGGTFEVRSTWIHIVSSEVVARPETYGFAGTQGVVNLEGILLRPEGVESKLLLVLMHPASTLQLLPLPRALATRGFHVLCAASRYARNDTAAILEKVVLDLGSYIRQAKAEWGYEKIVLLGWSGGGSLALFYQSQAEHPTIRTSPAGDLADIVSAGLIPADAVIFQAAHISRASMLVDFIDPSVKDECNPDDREGSLDIYDSAGPNHPPYSSQFIELYRGAQVARIRRITAAVKQRLMELQARDSGEHDRGFIVHRTMADPRFLDGSLEPNGRRVGWCYLGLPASANTSPVGLARFSTLRSWLSQWSLDDTNCDGLACAKNVSVPVLVIENGADEAVPQKHASLIYAAVASLDKTYSLIKEATHYYANQPQQLNEAVRLIESWLRQRSL